MPEDVFQAVRRKTKDLNGLLDGLHDINLRSEDGQCLLHTAVAYGNIEAARELVRRGIDVNAQDKNGQTPLHFAGSHCSADLAKLVLANGGDLTIPDRHGNTALWSAAFSAKGSYDTVRQFANTDCASLAQQKNKHGRSPLDFAKQIQDGALIRLLEGDG